MPFVKLNFKEAKELNSELVFTFIKFGAAMLIIMAVIALVTIFTPRLAKFIEKRRKDKPDPFGVDSDDNIKDVKGMFDAQHDEDFDPNYKIYNEDIYGFNRKTKKERNKNGKE